jgi:predicted nuclease of predicted toxin-antitoxin system
LRFLADENFPGPVVDALKSEGHDVLWARIAFPGAKDKALLSRAQAENRILLTFDKDFGELAFRSGLPASCGIVLFRLPASPPRQLHDRVMMALRQRIDWIGHFSVVEENRVRTTPLPRDNGKTGRRPWEAREPRAVYRVGKPKTKSRSRKRK